MPQALMKPLVIDISRYQPSVDFRKMYAAGIRGVLMKATQGTRYIDTPFKARVPQARAAGLLVGAYAFGTSAPVDDQVAHFLDVVGDDPEMLLALDFERNDPSPSDSMSYQQARRFLQLVFERTGQRPLLYSGNRIKECIPRKGDPFFNSHRLWLAHYVAVPTLPPGWDKAWLHQYAGDNHGALPRGISGIPANGDPDPNIDMNAFNGVDLAAEWIDRPAKAEPVVVAAAPPPILTPAASDGHVEEKASSFSLTSATSSAASINELASQGSRIAQTIRSIKQWFWTGVVGTSTASAFVSTDKGSGDIIKMAMTSHPFVVIFALAGILAVLGYFGIKLVEKYLVTAFRDGRYLPR